MTQEEQTALVDEQQAAANVAATTEANKSETEAKGDQENQEKATKGSDGQQEGQAQVRALFKQLIRMKSIRKLTPAAKAAKAAREAARAAANAAKAAEIAAKAADNAAKAAQDAAQAALDENAKAEEKKAAAEKQASEPVKGDMDNGKQQEEVAAK